MYVLMYVCTLQVHTDTVHTYDKSPLAAKGDNYICMYVAARHETAEALESVGV